MVDAPRSALLDCFRNSADRFCLVIAACDFSIQLNLAEGDAIPLLMCKPLQILTCEEAADFTRRLTVPIPKKDRILLPNPPLSSDPGDAPGAQGMAE
jgi:hypothetical protein